ncbi:hypothetical protein BJY04DRAFT_221081 [Aspergillus karnatakaensis]|uniref:putative HLH DNA binding domain protein n=1 Tax=Aspergillus karnatakaensis TaxID=1810916 RepID=UPI003CCCDB3F
MSFNGMNPMGGNVSQHCPLPGVHSLSSVSSSTDATETRRLPPPRPVVPLQRDLFSQYAHRGGFMPSPPSTRESVQVKSPWPPEHTMAPPSPASSADSWTIATWPQRSSRHIPGPEQLPMDQVMKILLPSKDNIRRHRKPLQQQCGRKRKQSMVSSEMDDSREKHRIAEGTRRKNISDLIQALDSMLDNYFLEKAGWSSMKNQSPSKEQILGAVIYYMETSQRVLKEAYVNGALPHDLPEKIQCWMQSEKINSTLQQQHQALLQQVDCLNQELKAQQERIQGLERRNRALEYQLKAREQMPCTPRSEQPNLQHAISLPDDNAKATLPALRVLCEEISHGSSDHSRYDALSPGPSQSFGASFLGHTPPTTGPSSPIFHQATYSVTTSRPPSLVQSPSP